MEEFNARVVDVGVEGTVVIIALESPTTPERIVWFRLNPALQQEMLSIAIVAMTSGMTVHCAGPLEKPTDGHAQLHRIRLTFASWS